MHYLDFQRVSYYAQVVHRPVSPADRSWLWTEALPVQHIILVIILRQE